MRRDNREKSNKGFTLVELIVVLVILAVLAAILTPALLGYIDQARSKRYFANAKTCFDAAQAMFSQQYAYHDTISVGDPIVLKEGATSNRDASTSGNSDQDITDTKFAADLLALAGLPKDMPYLFMVGVGSNLEEDGTTRTVGGRTYTVTTFDKYTIYYAVYMETKDSTAWYYYNGEWTTTNPRYNNKDYVFNKDNIVQTGPNAGVRIQYYLIACHNTKFSGKDKKSVSTGAFWDWLKSMK